jgi:site-specific recombinase XerD
VNTCLRWSEQTGLCWRDVDMLAGVVTVPRSKERAYAPRADDSRVRALLLDLGAARQWPDDPTEPVFPCHHAQADKFFPKAVERAQASLKAARKDASRLDGYTWHCNRHTFASRLVMAGVDLRSVQDLGGWRSLAMVQR